MMHCPNLTNDNRCQVASHLADGPVEHRAAWQPVRGERRECRCDAVLTTGDLLAKLGERLLLRFPAGRGAGGGGRVRRSPDALPHRLQLGRL